MARINLSTHTAAAVGQALRLERILSAADAVQWSPSPTPKPRDDTTERSKGGHGDPTLQTVVDSRRLEVRAAVEEAQRVLTEAARSMHAARTALEESVARWSGDSPD